MKAAGIVLTVRSVSSGSGCNFRLPLVTVGQELLLVVQQLLTGLGGIFSIGSLNNGINGAALLAVATVDTLGHINIITGRPTASVLTFFGLDGDSLSRADSFAKLASDATLLTGGIAAQSVFATETRRDGTFLEGVEDSVRWSEELLQHDVHAAENLRHEEVFAGLVQGGLGGLVPFLGGSQTETGWRGTSWGRSPAH